jgi:hypothetical protein
MKQANIQRAKSAAGILLVGVGILLLQQHLTQTMTHVSQLVGNLRSGMLPMVVMDNAQQTSQTGGSCLHRVLQQVTYQIFVSAWPLLLVRIGLRISP